MFRNYFITALRHLRRQRLHSLVNILGLSMGMTCTLLIMLWVRDELSYDRFHENFRRIYRVVADWPRNGWEGVNASPMPLGPAIREGVPEVFETVRFIGQPRKVFHYEDKEFYEDRGIVADPSLFTVFSFHFLKGSPSGAFRKASDMVLTETTAAKYFGDEDPIGKVIEVEGRPAVVTGVISNPPPHSTLRFDFVNSFEFVRDLTGYATHWGAFNFDTYVMLTPDADPKGTGSKITAIAASHKSPHVEMGLAFRLQPLSEVHLDARPYTLSTVDLGDSKSVALFSAVAAFILLIACVNFINLSTAMASRRAGEVGVRKTVGAGRGQLIRQFLGESFLLVTVAFMVAVGYVVLLLPAFNRLTGKVIQFDPFQGNQLPGLVAVLLLTGLAAGMYPAVVLSGPSPAATMRGGRRDGGRPGKRTVLRRALVVLQFSLSIVLLIMTLVLTKQVRFVLGTDLGFDRRNVVLMPLKGPVAARYESFKAGLLGIPGVVSVTAESYPFAEITNRSAGNWDWEGREGRENLDLVFGGVDYDFVETLGLRLATGRTFSREFGTDRDKAVLINESAAQAMGLAEPVGKWVSASRDGTDRRIIVGVVKDARFRSLHHGIEPMLYYLDDFAGSEDRGIVLARLGETGGDASGALSEMNRVWKEFNPHVPFESTYLDETYRKLYSKERQALILFNVFAGLAAVISCLGLFGLAAFVAERRTKEIGIRKVLGAADWTIGVLLTGEFTRWVLAANVIAWPVGFFAARKLLQVYAYRAEIGIGIFVLSGAATLAVAVLTVGRQAFKAARANPVDSLRYE